LKRRLDRRLIERTIEPGHTQEFGPRPLRAALDSSPLWGAGRVEDTYNLIGHALKKVIRVVAVQQGRDVAEVGQEAGATMVCGTSLKAALDRDWDQVSQREEALDLVVHVLRAVETWVQALPQEEMELAQPSLKIAQHIQAQDVAFDEYGKASLIKGVAKDRRISIEDTEMRHGRKSRSVRVDGYKRHVLHDLDSGLIRAVGITPANVPEASVTKEISADLKQQGVKIKELHIDRGYLSSHLVQERGEELEIYCKAWPVPKDVCEQCPLKAQCTPSSRGRSVSIHPDEALLIELRERQRTPEGRAKLRERVAVEHTLAHVDRWQGRHARYRGARKNLFDLRRYAVVHNLHVLARSRLLQADLLDAA
jgi:hypothetical protein